jgi:glycosyltransferase involved in cell wall biosynthesis
MPKINLLYVITKLELGGAQKQLLSLVKFLDKDKFNIFLFTAQEGLLVEDFGRIPGLTLKKSRYLERAINPLYDLLAVREIAGFIKENEIEIVHTHSSKAGIVGRLAAKIAGAKSVIHTVHGWPFHEYQPWLEHKLFLQLERFTGRFTDIFAVVSEFDRKKGLAAHIGLPEKYRRIYYGINFDEFKYQKSAIGLKKDLKMQANELVVTNISCFKPQKSPLDFIRLASLTMKAVPGVKFLLVGDGVLREKIERLINSLGLENRVVLAGWSRDIPGILSISDAVVLTSLWEGMPIAVLEALSSACPVVATDTGGVRELIKDGENGFLVQAKDMQKMAQKLALILGDGALREKMKEKAVISLDQNYAIDNMAECHQSLYQELALKKGVPGAS